MKGVAKKPDGTSRNFTIRFDWDFDDERSSRGRAKGFHVNVELPREKYAFCQLGGTKLVYLDRVQMLSERRLHDGDVKAAKWFMEGKRREEEGMIRSTGVVPRPATAQYHNYVN